MTGLPSAPDAEPCCGMSAVYLRAGEISSKVGQEAGERSVSRAHAMRMLKCGCA
jgi:hypothetical protein